MRKRVIIPLLVFLFSIYLLQAGLHGAIWMGQKWIETEANTVWWMNPSISVRAEAAYNYFAIAPMFLGGLIFGIAIVLAYKLACSCSFCVLRKLTFVVTSFAGSVLSTALAFNTFDWMVSYVTGSGGNPNVFTLWNFNMPFISIDGWNFYAFCVLAPLWIGGCFLATSLLFCVLCHDEL